MIDCTEYRRALLADPRSTSPELAAHLASCGECPAYTDRLLRFEARIERALRADLPMERPIAPAGGRGGAPLRGRWGGGWLAMAASVLLALTVAGGLWLGAPHATLAADVVAHMAGEPQAWARTDVPVPSPQLSPVLEQAHMRLRPEAGMVSYAQSCLFRGHHVPHLVVQTGNGPITVMVLEHESVRREEPFEEGGYRGVIVPVPGHGSLAVLAKDGETDLTAVESVAARVKDAIVWTG
ncbi:MAG TPA: DUF3379 family protein [Steroidobacteraceae bacterium]|nr:DUF3379 family protein [Steroidobacteraceae bacterium]HUO19934.1 DUF3379 family protein [Steroidobacteraceae bacterium]